MINSDMIISKIELFYCIKLRKQAGDSVQNIAKNININFSLLYDIEAGRRLLNHATFNKILNYYNTTYNFDQDLYNESYGLTIELFKKIIAQNYDNVCLIYLNNKHKIDMYKISKAFIFVDLIKVIYLFACNNRENAKKYLDYASQYIELFDTNIFTIYVLLYSFLYKIKQNISIIQKSITNIYDNYPLNNLDKTIEAMLYLETGRIFDIGGNYFEALKYLDKAYICFLSLNLYQKATLSKIQKILCFFELKQFNIAKEEYIKTFEESQQLGYVNCMNICSNNLALLYFIEEDYENTMKYIEISRKNGSTFPDLNYYLAYIIYKTKNKSVARKEIKLLIDKETDIKTLHILNFIRAMLNENENKIQKYFNLSEKIIIKEKDFFDHELLYKMAIDYYHMHDIYKENYFLYKLISII